MIIIPGHEVSYHYSGEELVGLTILHAKNKAVSAN